MGAGGWGIKVQVKNHVFYQNVVNYISEFMYQTPWQEYSYSPTEQCFLYTLTIEHTAAKRIIKLYIDEFLAKTMEYDILPTDNLTHGGKVVGGLADLNETNNVANYNSTWGIKIWTGIRSQDQVQLDAGLVPSNPIINPTALYAHWTLKGGELQDLTTLNGDVEPIPSYVTGTINPLLWKDICCGMPPNPYLPEQISLADEKTACEDRFKEIGKRDAQIIIDRKRNELLAAYTAKYSHDCLNTNEEFTYSYQTAEHHYTLYYYDQAGNLVQTVSPEGVETDGTDNHNLKTRYAYNSLNAPIDQETPDAGESKFFYDKVARIRLSQNAQQKVDQNYSYTKYDAQGRIIEVGQLEKNADGTNPVINELLEKVDLITFPSQTDYLLTQITRTFYDDQATGTPTQIVPKNLRGRIAAVKVFEDGQT